jgi:hypothetical protein
VLRCASSTAVLVAALALTGCGKSAPDQVRDTVGAFRDATAKKDYHRICKQVLAPALVSRLTDLGLPCEVALSKYLDATSRPTLTISRVAVKGASAQAFVTSSAKGQARSLDIVSLVKTGDGWRIASLARPKS